MSHKPKHWIMCLAMMICALVIVFSVMAITCKAESYNEVYRSILNRGTYFDSTRFDTAVVMDFTDQATEIIATIGKTNQKQAIVKMLTGTLSYLLPTDFYLVEAVMMNADPGGGGGPDEVPYLMKFRNIDEIGLIATQGTGRPKEYAIWADSIKFGSYTQTGTDSAFLYYFAHPTQTADSSATVDIPDQYLPLLKDAVVQMCIERIEYPGRKPKDEALALTNLIKEAILGREAD